MRASRPLVSVVTAVYNGDRWLARSLRSVLRQEGVDLEMVVVDDGSTDGTSQILAGLAAEDARVRVVRQENSGLTLALARGCAEARGDLIARHDADDISLPGRFRRQAELLGAEPLLSLVSCWSLVLGPGDEVLQEYRRSPEMARPTALLSHDDEGPLGHGSAMFRRGQYETAGGYRAQFYYAQDVDLWYRLADVGKVAFVPEFLYAYRFGRYSISMRSKGRQDCLGRLAADCRRARAEGRPEDPILAQASRIRPGGEASALREAESDGDYFVGRCLLDRRDRRASGYLWSSARRHPLRLKGWAALAASLALCRLVPPNPAALEDQGVRAT